jgi:hypothetical protein
MVWSHTKKRCWRLPYYGTLRQAGREEDKKIVGEVRLSKKRGEVGNN